MNLEELNIFKSYVDNQVGRKYPCSNQIVTCGIFTDDKNKAILYMSDKKAQHVIERKDSIEWILENGERWLWKEWNSSYRGYRFYKIAVDKNINRVLFDNLIAPYSCLYCCSMDII